MARAGFSNAEIMSGVGGVLDAAAASGLEMAEVANHVSNVMKGMGLEAAEAGRVADVLTVASSATNSSIGSLGESMKNLSPVAKQFGVSLEDAVGMVALLQDVGLDASEAGTATSTEGSFFAGVDEHMNEQARKRAKAEAARAKATEHIAPEIGAIGTESFMSGILDQIPALEKDLGGVGEIGGSAFTQSIIDSMPGLQAELDRLNVPRIVIEHQAVGGSDPGVAQMVSDRSVMHDIRESIQTTESRLTIEDRTGKATLTTPKRSGIELRQPAPSGAM